MNLKLEIEFSKAEIFNQVNALKKQIDDMRPLPADIEGRVMQKLRLDWNYNSNAIEGNKLSYGETTALLMHGITAKGKPLKDHLDIQGHNEAIDLLLRMVQDERPITEADIRGLHEVILGQPHNALAQTAEGTPTTKIISVGEYKTMPNHVQTITGAIHYYASPEETPAKMQELMEWYNQVSNNTEIHPILIAALFHHRLVAIHPFDDGNGRMARILMNLVLMRNGYPVAVINNSDKDEYYSLLSRADVDELWPFTEYIIERVERSLKIYIKAINGEDIREEQDLDRELALFKLEMQGKLTPKLKGSAQEINRTVVNVIFPLIDWLVLKLISFNDLFNEISIAFATEPPMENSLYDYNIANHENVKVYKDIIGALESGVVLNTIDLSIILSGFKNPDNEFDVYKELSIQFDREDFFVSDSNKLEISKAYNQEFDLNDKAVILTSVMNEIRSSINENLINKKA